MNRTLKQTPAGQRRQLLRNRNALGGPLAEQEPSPAARSLSANFAASAYRRVAVAVPPLMAVVKLFDGAIISLQRAIQAIEAKRIEEGHGHVTRATAILRGLKYHLDFDRGGALAERLHSTYTRFILTILRTFGRKDAIARYQRIIQGLSELRDAWASVAGLPPKSAERQKAV